MIQKILLDTNVILDIALNREPFVVSASLLFDKIDEKSVKAFMSASTITDIFYIMTKAKDKSVARNFVKHSIEIIDIIAIDKEVIKNAIFSDIIDFEDAVQIKAAEINDLDAIITRNKIDFMESKIPVFTPIEFLEELK
jgi:predicted nucleic acid-binding protein